MLSSLCNICRTGVDGCWVNLDQNALTSPSTKPKEESLFRNHGFFKVYIIFSTVQGFMFVCLFFLRLDLSKNFVIVYFGFGVES